MATSGARVHIYGDWDGTGVKKAQQDISYFEKQATGLGGSITKSFMGIGAAIGGAFALGSITSTVVDFLQSSMQAAIEDEKSMVALKTAMDNVGLSAQNAPVEDFIKNLSLATGVADDQLRPAMQRLVTATGDAAQSQKLLSLALDISVATGKDATTVATALGKAANGQVSALTRLGIPLDANIVKTKDFGAAVDVLNQKFGGQASAAADTYGGQLQRLKVAADEAKETVGYALLNAVADVTDKFGGAGGLSEAITKLGEDTADFVAGLGLVASGIADVVAQVNSEPPPADESFWGWLQNFLSEMGTSRFAPADQAIADIKQAGADVRAEAEAQQRVIDATAARWTGYAAALRPAVVATREAADAEEQAKEQADLLKAAVNALTRELSASQSMDDFKKRLADLDKTLEGNKRSFKGMSDGAKENRDELRAALGQAADIARQWVEDGKISADQYEAAYKGLAKKTVNQFVADGFKRKDIEAFMGGQGLWTGPITKALTGAEAVAVAQATGAGWHIGKALIDGVVVGMRKGTPNITTQAWNSITAAEHAANSAADSHSPSRVWAGIGKNLMDGLKEGMIVGWPELAAQITKGMQGLTIVMRGESVKLTTETADAFAKQRDIFNDIVDAQTAKITEAKQALNDYADSVASTVIGNVDMSAVNADGSPMTAEQWVNSIIGGIGSQGDLVAAVAQVTGLVPEAIQQKLLSMAPEQGIRFANFLADPANSALVTTLNWNYEGLATFTKNALGIPMANAFATVGDQSAVSMIKSAKAKIAAAAEGFQKWVASHLSTDIDVRVHIVGDSLPGRATGGPVTSGQAYLVGERGPELFVPSVSGSVVPNDRLGSSSSGATYNITVQAGVGDPASIGRTVVESIRAYERRSGKVFVAA